MSGSIRRIRRIERARVHPSPSLKVRLSTKKALSDSWQSLARPATQQFAWLWAMAVSWRFLESYHTACATRAPFKLRTQSQLRLRLLAKRKACGKASIGAWIDRFEPWANSVPEPRFWPPPRPPWPPWPGSRPGRPGWPPAWPAWPPAARNPALSLRFLLFCIFVRMPRCHVELLSFSNLRNTSIRCSRDAPSELHPAMPRWGPQAAFRS